MRKIVLKNLQSKYKNLFVALFALAIVSIGKASESNKHLKIKIVKEYVTSYMKKIVAIEQKIKALPPQDAELAILLSGGLLKDKMVKFKNMREEQGKFDESTFFYILGRAVQRQAMMYQSIGNYEASICLLKETESLKKMSEGGVGAIHACREDAIGHEVLIRGETFVSEPNAKEIYQLCHEWSGYAVLLFDRSRELETLALN